MGFSNWQTLKPHALRAPFITFLANDNSMSTQETMGAARHRSVGASTPYQKRSLESEDNRLKAVLGKRTINNDDDDFEEPKSNSKKLSWKILWKNKFCQNAKMRVTRTTLF